MKTCQGTGSFQQANLRLLLCIISSVVFATSAHAFTAPNLITACSDCHGSPTTALGGGTALRPVDAAWRNITTGGFVGNHQTHVVDALSSNSFACTPCHGPSPTALDHRDGRINMRLHINSTAVNVRGFYDKPVGAPAAFFNQTSVPQLSTCNNVNCHFRTTTPAWGSAALTGGQTVANCQICHQSTGMDTGNHTKHITKFGSTITTCSTCHPNQTTFSHATSAKAGRSITVTFAGAPSLSTGGTYAAGTHASYPNYFGTTGYGTCNTIYCHSSAQSVSGGAPVYKAQAWGTTLNCSGCHGSTTTDLLSGSHSKHLIGAYTASLITCGSCHGAGYTFTAVNDPTHVNQTINISLTTNSPAGTYSGDGTPGNSNFGSCATSICHGKNSATWGTSVSSQLCTECHGQANVAYANTSSAIIAPGGNGVDTGGNIAASSPRVGSHQTHLLASSNISAAMKCESCHVVVTTVQQASHLNYTTATVTFQGLATNGTNSPTAAKTGGIYNCSNVYCHVANRPAGTGPNQSGIATSPVPVWNDTALIGGTTIADTCAAKCHGLPPGALQAGDNNHSALAVVTTFSGLTTCSCHNAVINTGATSFATIFSDRSKHINGVVDASNGHVLPYPGSTHMNAAGATTPASTCGVCHNTTLAGPYPATTLGSAPNCMGCHKLGLLRTVATSSCYDCHGASATDGRPNGAVFPNYSGSHSKHVVTMGYTCASCHANGGTGSANHGPSNRINSTGIAFVHVTSTTRDFHFTPVGKGSCSTAYCHSSGQSVSGTSATPVYVVVTWGGTALCGSCHATTSIASGSHTKHLSVSTNCGNCHTGSSETAYSSASHVNRLIDVGVGSYSAGGAPGNGYGTCTTALCHSNGATTPVYKPATWGTANTAACNFCHDALPTTGSHSIHIANYSFGCAECHGHNGTGSAHIDGSVQIVAAVGYNGSKQCATSDCHSNGKATGFAYTTSPAWGTLFTGDRCAGCHGNWPTGDAHTAHVVGIHYDDVYRATGGKIAASGAVGVNAGHGDPAYSTTVSCNMCHNTVVTVNYNDLGTTCNTAACHGTGGTAKGSLTTASVSKSLHVNRVRDVSFATATMRSKAQIRNDITTVPELNNYWTRTNAYKAGASSHDASKATVFATATFTSGTCSAVVCHNGNPVSWTAGAITCDKCHTALP